MVMLPTWGPTALYLPQLINSRMKLSPRQGDFDLDSRIELCAWSKAPSGQGSLVQLSRVSCFHYSWSLLYIFKRDGDGYIYLGRY
jgi:hypothetical protein